MQAAAQLLDPKNDAAFKKLFGTEKNKKICLHFLNDMLELEDGPLVDLKFLKPIQDPETARHKLSAVDVLCQDHKGGFYIIEMQVAEEKGFAKRAQYYAAKTYVSQLVVAGKYYNLKEVIFLAITNFVMFPNKNNFISHHVTLDKHTKERDLKDFSFTFVELPKFRKSINELGSMADRWAYFFKRIEKITRAELQKLNDSEGIIQSACDELLQFNWTQEEMYLYDSFQKGKGSLMGQIKAAEEKGAEEERIKCIKILLANGVLLEKISEDMNIGIDEVQQIAGSGGSKW